MQTINLYSFHRKIANYRFDAHNTKTIINKLSEKYKINHYDIDGDDNYFYQNDCNVTIDQGSISDPGDWIKAAFKSRQRVWLESLYSVNL